jgi:hypothetical protein
MVHKYICTVHIKAAYDTLAGVDGPGLINANYDGIGKYDDNDNDNIIAVANVQQANAPHKPQPIVKVQNDNSVNDNIAKDYAYSYDDDNNDGNNSVASIKVNPILQLMQWRPKSQMN